MIKKVIILTDGHLPVPAVQGGAVPTLVEILIRENENKKMLHFYIVSKYNEQAKVKAEKYLHTEFVFVKENYIIKKIDTIMNYFINKLLPPGKRRSIDVIWKIVYINAIKKVLIHNSFDAVIIENHGFLTRIFESKRVFDKYEGKIFYHLHNEIPDSATETIGRNCRFILVSNYLSKKIIRRYGDNARFRISVLKNGIRNQNYNQVLNKNDKEMLRLKLGFSNNDYVICYVGRICKEKGIMELLQAIEMIKNPMFKLMIIGASEFGNNIFSEFESNIQKICRNLGERVKITGYVGHEEIWRYYQLSDVAVLPSMWEEPAGLTILEAMASGIPVITTDAGGIPEYIGNNHGLIVKRDNDIVGNIIVAISDVFDNREYWKNKAEEDVTFIKKNYSEENYYCSFVSILQKYS